MKRGTLAGSILLLCFISLPATAQYSDYAAEQRGWSLPGTHPSVRLAAMGGLQFTIRDENNELNVSDFGGNLAGVLADRQGWTVESWGGRRNNTRDVNSQYHGAPVRQRDRFDQQLSGLDVVYRQEGQRAIGVVVAWGGHDSRQRYGTNGRVTATGYEGFYVETFGRVTAAGGVTMRADNEDVVSPDVFAIRHTSKTRSGRLAVMAPMPLAGFVAAAQVDFDRVRIEGISADPGGYHDDRFFWRRPATRYAVALLRPEASTSPLAVGLRCSVLDRTGREEGHIRWSDRFSSNPGGVNLAINVPIFEETESGWQADARASYELGPTFRLAGAARLLHFESEVDEAPNSNFLGSRSESALDRDAWSLGGGAGLTLLAQRLRIGFEGSLQGVSDDETQPRARSETKARRYDVRSGAEYLMPSRLALRLGYQRASHDLDVDAPGTLELSNGGTFGLGFVPYGGVIALDGAVRLWNESPEQAGTENRKAESQDLMLSVRVIF